MADQLLTMFVVNPWLAIIPALLLYWLSRRTKSRAAFIAGLLWTIYFLYELAIWFQLSFACEEGCDLRVDLLIIYPLLAAATLIALVKFFLTKFKNSR